MKIEQLLAKWPEILAFMVAGPTFIYVIYEIYINYSNGLKVDFTDTKMNFALVLVNISFVLLLWLQIRQSNVTMNEVKDQTETMRNQLRNADEGLTLAKEAHKKNIDDEKRAILTPEYIFDKDKIKQDNTFILRITNSGKAVAKNIRVKLDGTKLQGVPHGVPILCVIYSGIRR